jgi:hypothetical protein
LYAPILEPPRYTPRMYTFVAIAFIFGTSSYVILQLLLHLTQNKREPQLLESTIPFLDSAIGIFKHRVGYLESLRYVSTYSYDLNPTHITLTDAVIKRASILFDCRFSASMLCMRLISSKLSKVKPMPLHSCQIFWSLACYLAD